MEASLGPAAPQIKDLLFHRGSPPRFLAFDLLLWDCKGLGACCEPTARNTEVDANHTDFSVLLRYN
jgi:hypothetical protein